MLVAQPHSTNQDAGALTVEGALRAHNAVLGSHSLGVLVAGRRIILSAQGVPSEPMGEGPMPPLVRRAKPKNLPPLLGPRRVPPALCALMGNLRHGPVQPRKIACAGHVAHVLPTNT